MSFLMIYSKVVCCRYMIFSYIAFCLWLTVTRLHFIVWPVGCTIVFFIKTSNALKYALNAPRPVSEKQTKCISFVVTEDYSDDCTEEP